MTWTAPSRARHTHSSSPFRSGMQPHEAQQRRIGACELERRLRRAIPPCISRLGGRRGGGGGGQPAPGSRQRHPADAVHIISTFINAGHCNSPARQHQQQQQPGSRAETPGPGAGRGSFAYTGSPNGPIQRLEPVRYVQYECYETTARSETRKLARVRPARCPA
jgi:hypothetical protein